MTQSVREREEYKSRMEIAEDVLERSGFRRCNIAACNCGSWHQVGGFKLRFDEIKEVIEEAGYSTNGRVLLDAVKQMANDASEILRAVEALDSIRQWEGLLPNLRAEHHGPKCSAFDALSSCIDVAREAINHLTRDKG